MAHRDTMFLISDADSMADEVRQKAEEFRDHESRVDFYERVISEISYFKCKEQGKIKYD